MKALIIGIFGQDGSFLCEYLNSLGYEVYGIIHSPLSDNSQKIRDELRNERIEPKVYEADITCYMMC